MEEKYVGLSGDAPPNKEEWLKLLAAKNVKEEEKQVRYLLSLHVSPVN